MSYTATISEEIDIGGQKYTKQNALSGDAQLLVSEAVAHPNTDYEIACAIDVSKVIALAICSDQDVLFETNDGSSPDDDWTLKAGIPYIWYTNKYDDLLLTVDVTSVFISNDSGSTAQIEIYVITDPTL